MATTRTSGPGGTREDPYVGMHFRADAGATIGYFTEVSGLSMEYEVEEYKEGGVNDFVHKLRGRMKFTNLVLKRGITSNEEYVKWFVACREKIERRELTVTMFDQTLNPVRTWSFAGAFPVKWSGPDFKASPDGAAIETVEIAHQGLTSVPG
jgi:phage tail-like protein